MKMISPTRTEWILGICACALSLSVSLIFVFQARGSVLPFLPDNTLEYFYPAKNMIERGVYSMDPAPPFSPSRFRPPGLSFIMAGLYALGDARGLLGILMLNAFAFSCSALLTYRLAKNFISERAALATALLFTLDPLSLRYNASLLADTIATFLILLILLMLLNLWKHPTWQRTLGTGALIAIGVYIRPNLLFLMVPTVLIIAWRQAGWRRIGMASLCAFVLVLAMLPWQIRNARTFGNAHFASLDWQYLYYVAGAYVVADHEDRPWRAVRRDMQGVMQKKYPPGTTVHGELVESGPSAPVGSFLVRESLNVLRPYPASVIKTALAGYARFFFDDGAHELAYAIAPAPVTSEGMVLLITEGRFLDALKNFWGRSPPVVTAFVFGKLLWVMLYLGVVLGTVRICQKRVPRSYGVLLATLLGFLMVAATLALPVSESRHRMLYQPLLYLWGVSGWAAWERARVTAKTGTPRGG